MRARHWSSRKLPRTKWLSLFAALMIAVLVAACGVEPVAPTAPDAPAEAETAADAPAAVEVDLDAKPNRVSMPASRKLWHGADVDLPSVPHERD